ELAEEASASVRAARSRDASADQGGVVGSRPAVPAGAGLRAVALRRPARSWGIAGVVLAAAAAWLLWPRVTPVVAEPVDLASVAVEPQLGDAFDLAGLRAGDVVEASEGPVSFGRAGVL